MNLTPFSTARIFIYKYTPTACEPLLSLFPELTINLIQPSLHTLASASSKGTSQLPIPPFAGLVEGEYLLLVVNVPPDVVRGPGCLFLLNHLLLTIISTLLFPADFTARTCLNLLGRFWLLLYSRALAIAPLLFFGFVLPTCSLLDIRHRRLVIFYNFIS